jgi:hypothetical protein
VVLRKLGLCLAAQASPAAPQPWNSGSIPIASAFTATAAIRVCAIGSKMSEQALSGEKSKLAVDFLNEAMMFYRRGGEGTRLVQQIIRRAEMLGEIRLAISLKKTFEDVVDSYNQGNDILASKIAAELAKYQTPKLANVELKTSQTNKYIVEVPRRTMSDDELVEKAKCEKELIEEAKRQMKLIQHHINKVKE